MLYAWDIRDEGVDPTHKALTITRSLQSCRGDRYYGEMVQRCTEHSESVKVLIRQGWSRKGTRGSGITQ